MLGEGGVAGGDDRALREVVLRHRRRQGPLERAAVPRIGGALRALEGGVRARLAKAMKTADAEDEGADGGDEFQSSQPLPAW
jgi:hypothetical protein